MTLDELRERERRAELRALETSYDRTASEEERDAATAAWVVALTDRYDALRAAAEGGYL